LSSQYAGAGNKPVDDLPLRTTYYFNRWLWVQFPLIALGNTGNMYEEGISQADKLNYRKKPKLEGGDNGSKSPGKSKSGSGFVFTIKEPPQITIDSKKFALPEIKFNRKAARSFRRQTPADEMNVDADEGSNQIEQRTIALTDTIQAYREEFDFLYQQKLVLNKQVRRKMMIRHMSILLNEFNSMISIVFVFVFVFV